MKSGDVAGSTRRLLRLIRRTYAHEIDTASMRAANPQVRDVTPKPRVPLPAIQPAAELRNGDCLDFQEPLLIEDARDDDRESRLIGAEHLLPDLAIGERMFP
jgi:hypothetical protein